MSSSKSKKRTNSDVDELVDLDPECTRNGEGASLDDDEEEETEATQATQPSNSTGRQKGVAKRYKKRAECWEYFDPIFKNGIRVEAKCMFCGIIYKAHSSRNGTKNLKNHWPICPENPSNQTKGMTQTQLAFVKGENEGEAQLKSWVLNPHDARDALTKMIIIDELPFRFVDKPGFRYFMSVVCPGLNMPCRTTVARDCYKLYVEERVKLKELFVQSCQRVCVTTHTWTDRKSVV